jgi:hypothetical protein
MDRATLITTLKFLGLLFLFLIWAILIQVEYELITNPEARDDFPLVKGIPCVILFTFVFFTVSCLLVAYRHIFWDAIRLMRLDVG